MPGGAAKRGEWDPALSVAGAAGTWVLAYSSFPPPGNAVKTRRNLKKRKHPFILEQGRRREDTVLVQHHLKI